MTTLGLIFPPSRPPEQLKATARAAEDAGLEQLWLWEDCFKESGIATAAAVLGWTERLAVGIGLLPVPLRNVALTAMELATIERLFPGRLVPGVGHGVLEWMGQVGARAESPMTLLREYTLALRQLLAGDKVTVEGRYVRLSEVALDWPPAAPPSVLVGAVRDKTVQLAGEVGDGVILTDEAKPERVREVVRAIADARASAGRGASGGRGASAGRGASGGLDVGDRRDASAEPASSDEPGTDAAVTSATQVVAFIPVDHGLDAAGVADVVGRYADAGATHTILLAVGDDEQGIDLADYARFVAAEVRPLVP
ncbi:MAG TPA: LLM class flavin-dependent oxidoreductase [Segeticoccus sp.]|uniref:LLM class flavin-dependent oxidoreductase n=1 Tax=Segeticoccus sp. TaxID=2706531 RepID=UPI002D7F3B05|nr:LLM class flavin-dependent oxidoreductase [Segeticoccus sp.]HET8600345.1 LLM class flavin-dependent oxidoreductase [Segeticoccus sp.]